MCNVQNHFGDYYLKHMWNCLSVKATGYNASYRTWVCHPLVGTCDHAAAINMLIVIGNIFPTTAMIYFIFLSGQLIVLHSDICYARWFVFIWKHCWPRPGEFSTGLIFIVFFFRTMGHPCCLLWQTQSDALPCLVLSSFVLCDPR